VSSHGHTIFHQPSRGFTVQIGSGPAIAAACRLPVVYDFRSLDVALGGQGAPLVPAGDRLLFPEYDYCLNLGGIANISFEKNNERIAFDICACNIVLNYFASKKGLSFDKGGELARKGTVNDSLLKALNSLEYYTSPIPKSLGREDIEKHVFPLIKNHNLTAENNLATFTSHIAEQIGKTIDRSHGKLLITGGGAFNSFLVEKISEQVKLRTIVPDNNIVNFKEAIIFGFLGVLRMEKQNNCLKSVTGSIADNCGGAIIHYESKEQPNP
jgi:anhydro-N-acetylmuramic acid kinase